MYFTDFSNHLTCCSKYPFSPINIYLDIIDYVSYAVIYIPVAILSLPICTIVFIF